MRVSSMFLASCVLAAVTATGGCNRASDSTGSENKLDQTGIGTGGSETGNTPVTMTGCVQEASGVREYVLSDVANQGARPEMKQTYKLEEGKDLDRMVGKQVRVTGQLETVRSNSASSDKDSGDLSKIHVTSIEQVSDNCSTGSTTPSSSRDSGKTSGGGY